MQEKEKEGGAEFLGLIGAKKFQTLSKNKAGCDPDKNWLVICGPKKRRGEREKWAITKPDDPLAATMPTSKKEAGRLAGEKGRRGGGASLLSSLAQKGVRFRGGEANFGRRTLDSSYLEGERGKGGKKGEESHHLLRVGSAYRSGGTKATGKKKKEVGFRQRGGGGKKKSRVRSITGRRKAAPLRREGLGCARRGGR